MSRPACRAPLLSRLRVENLVFQKLAPCNCYNTLFYSANPTKSILRRSSPSTFSTAKSGTLILYELSHGDGKRLRCRLLYRPFLCSTALFLYTILTPAATSSARHVLRGSLNLTRTYTRAGIRGLAEHMRNCFHRDRVSNCWIQ